MLFWNGLNLGEAYNSRKAKIVKSGLLELFKLIK